MAAAEAGKELTYFTFGVKNLGAAIQEVHSLLVKHKITVGQVWKELEIISHELFPDTKSAIQQDLVEPSLFKRLIEKLNLV